jgi:hypothetical protein
MLLEWRWRQSGPWRIEEKDTVLSEPTKRRPWEMHLRAFGAFADGHNYRKPHFGTS